MKRGNNQKTRFAVLGMLTIQPMSGYDIRKAIGESIAHFWNESYGQIYPILKQLAKEGLIAPHQSGGDFRNRREYTITAKGRTALATWLAIAPGKEIVRNELLLKLFFARNTSLQQSLQHIEEFCRSQDRELQRFHGLERELLAQHAGHPDLPYWLITLRFGIRNCEAAMRWAEEALRQLRRSAQTKRKAGRI